MEQKRSEFGMVSSKSDKDGKKEILLKEVVNPLNG